MVKAAPKQSMPDPLITDIKESGVCSQPRQEPNKQVCDKNLFKAECPNYLHAWTLGQHTRGDLSPEEFTQRGWSPRLVPLTARIKRFEEQVAGTCTKIQIALNSWDQL